jgi:hypothetical protein
MVFHGSSSPSAESAIMGSDIDTASSIPQQAMCDEIARPVTNIVLTYFNLTTRKVTQM